MTGSVAIVVPMRNEIAIVADLIEHLQHWRARGCEVLVVDGSSTDGSAEAVRRAGLEVVGSLPGRAVQMNAGAGSATSDVVLFLHADTRLPDNADRMVAAAVACGRLWGRFDVHILGKPMMLRLVAAMMNCRSRWTGIATGDQAMFVRRETFVALGGFPRQPLMEDIELSRRLRALSPPACIATKAQTSGRRWEVKGVWRTIVLMWSLRLAYWLGAPVERLARVYR